MSREIAALDEGDLLEALQPFVMAGWETADGDGGVGTVRMSPEAARAVVALCCGEPFLFQLAGQRAWNAGTSPVVSEGDVVEGWRGAEGEASAHVERVLGRLPDREHEFVTAMAALAPTERTLTRIAEAMGMDSATQIGAVSRRLDTVRGIVDRGKPYTFRNRAVEAYLTTDWPRVG